MGEAPPRASARARLGLLPEVMSDEDGENFYALGHVDRYAFVLALMMSVGADEGTEEAFKYVVGFTHRPEWRSMAEEFVTLVRHVWWRERPDIGDEAMERCGADDEGAQAFTEVTVR